MNGKGWILVLVLGTMVCGGGGLLLATDKASDLSHDYAIDQVAGVAQQTSSTLQLALILVSILVLVLLGVIGFLSVQLWRTSRELHQIKQLGPVDVQGYTRIQNGRPVQVGGYQRTQLQQPQGLELLGAVLAALMQNQNNTAGLPAGQQNNPPERQRFDW